MRRYLRVFFALAALFAVGVVRTHGDQYSPLPPDMPAIPDPQIPNSNDPEDPYCNPFGPMTTPIADLPDFPPEIPFPPEPPHDLIPFFVTTRGPPRSPLFPSS